MMESGAEQDVPTGDLLGVASLLNAAGDSLDALAVEIAQLKEKTVSGGPRGRDDVRGTSCARARAWRKRCGRGPRGARSAACVLRMPAPVLKLCL